MRRREDVPWRSQIARYALENPSTNGPLSLSRQLAASLQGLKKRPDKRSPEAVRQPVVSWNELPLSEAMNRSLRMWNRWPPGCGVGRLRSGYRSLRESFRQTLPFASTTSKNTSRMTRLSEED